MTVKYDLKNVLTNKVKPRISSIVQLLYKYIIILLGKLPVKKNLIMFESFLGKQYSDSPRAIYEYISQHNPTCRMYWSVASNHLKIFKEKDIRHVKRFSIKWLWCMARADYWVSNSRLPLWIPKPKHTTYLQTWHGTPLKRLASDMDEVHMPSTNTAVYKQNFLKESSKWDYLISPNIYSTEIFKRAFQFDKTIIESGYPRNDFLINSNNTETISKIKQATSLPRNKKIILYAPTWRDNQFYATGKYKFNLELDLNRLKETFGDDYIIDRKSVV